MLNLPEFCHAWFGTEGVETRKVEKGEGWNCQKKRELREGPLTGTHHSLHITVSYMHGPGLLGCREGKDFNQYSFQEHELGTFYEPGIGDRLTELTVYWGRPSSK